MSSLKLVPLMLFSLLTGCSDERASFFIEGSEHALSIVRQQQFFWDKQAEFILVAARMPDCMRRHHLDPAPLNSRVEVYSPGNDAWIVKLGRTMYVTETRTCEGFAKLDAEPEGGIGPLVGTFEDQTGKLVFVPAAK